MIKKTKADVGGFTLIELMITVTIIAILAAVAVPIFTKHIRKSRTSEAVSNLGAIAMYQETYFSENDSYVTCGPNPADVSSGERGEYDAGITGWALLGNVMPDGRPIWFQYEVRAGQFDQNGNPVLPASNPNLVSWEANALPGVGDCSNHTDLNAKDDFGITNAANSNWYYITAVADQRGNGKCSLFWRVVDRPDVGFDADTDIE